MHHSSMPFAKLLEETVDGQELVEEYRAKQAKIPPPAQTPPPLPMRKRTTAQAGGQV